MAANCHSPAARFSPPANPQTHLAALLDRVEKGETITITRHGRAVAVLAPAPGGAERTVEEIVAELKRLRRGRRLGDDLTVRDLIDAGRQ